MGKHSAIGPIDPQVNGIPAHTILQDYEQAKQDVLSNPALANLWAPRLMSMQFGFLNLCSQNIQLSKEKVAQWLELFMFNRSANGKAQEISEWLGNFDEHRTHGRPIGFDLAKKKGLVVKRLEDDQSLQELVLSIYHATMVTFQVTSCLKVIENHNGKGHYFVATIAPPATLGDASQPAPGPFGPTNPSLSAPAAAGSGSSVYWPG